MKAKVLIVGGGVMGNAIALAAAQRFDALKEPVVLLERGQIAGGSSGSSGGIVRQNFADRHVSAMARDSMREYAAFESRTGRSVGFHRPGVLTLAGPRRPESIERLKENLEIQRSLGINREVLNEEQIREKVPGIEVEPGTIGAWEPEGGFVDAQLAVREFAALARTYGASTRVGVEIQDLVLKDGRVVGAETTEGHYDLEHLVIVAGAWSGRFLAKFGVDLPLKVARVPQLFVDMPGEDDEAESKIGETHAWNVDLEDPMAAEAERLGDAQDDAAPGMGHPVIIDLELGFYTRCEPSDWRTRVCPIGYEPGLMRDLPDDQDSMPRREDSQALRKLLVERLPAYKDQADSESIVSWFPLTPDGRALVGPVPGIQGAHIAAGFADHGFKLAPSVGEGFAQLLLGEPVSAFQPELFAPNRFEGCTVEPDWSGNVYL
ncbi:MAG: NAD(P)/FAD-dependent oxidoreductase [Planctomycetota bacterium]|jgi:sarcosine oxidase subunit beta